MMDPSFDLCMNFPELCGFETDFDSFEIPTFQPAEEANVYISGDTENYYTCRAVLYERFGVVSDVIDSLNYFYNANITAGAEYNMTIEMGARKYESLDVETSTQIGESYDVTANFYVPELSIFYDFDAAEEFFDEIFGADEDKAHFDVMGEAWSHKEIETTNSTGTFYDDAFSRVQVGYKTNTTEEEPIYIGFIFEAEFPQDKLISGAEVIQWAKYTLYDKDGNETDVSYAVGCSSFVGNQNATTVKTYEKTLNIESMDDAELENLEVEDQWEIDEDLETEYYGLDYENVEKEGNVVQRCVVFQEWSAPDEEVDTVFGYYFMESGVRYIYTDESNTETIVDIENAYWDAEYRAPEDTPELNIQVQGQHETVNTIQVTENDGTVISGTIKQSMYIGYEIVEDLESDNIMGMFLSLDLPTELAANGTVIVQSVRYRKEFNFGGDYVTVSCKTVVGDSTKSEVLNYRGQDKIDGNDSTGSATTYDMTGELDLITEEMAEDGAEFYQMREDDEGAYALEEYGEYTGNSKQNCLVQLPFPKVDMDMEWFGMYEVEFDARIYESETSTSFEQIETTYTTQDFQPPIYTDAELVEEIEKINDVHQIQFMYEEFEFDGQQIAGEYGGMTGYQTIIGTLFVSPDPTEDQILEIMMTTTIPATVGEGMEGMTIMNYITFQNDDDEEADPAKIVCRTRVGDKYDHSVSQYLPETDLSAEEYLWNTTAELSWEESFFTASPNADKFETESDGTDAWATCTIELVMNEFNMEMVGDLFDVIYNIEYGVKAFDENDEFPVQIAESTFKILLPYPEYDDSWNDETEEALAEEAFMIDTTTFTTDGSQKDAYMAFEVKFNVTAEYDMPDVLSIHFATDAPAEALASGSEVVQWAQFRLTSDVNGEYQKVACRSIVDFDISGVTIDTYFGYSGY